MGAVVAEVVFGCSRLAHSLPGAAEQQRKAPVASVPALSARGQGCSVLGFGGNGPWDVVVLLTRTARLVLLWLWVRPVGSPHPLCYQ